MTTKLKSLIDAAQKLSPDEQIELISAVSQSLQRSYQQETAIPMDFWKPKTLAQITHGKKYQPVSNIADLAAHFRPEEESADDVIKYIYTLPYWSLPPPRI